MGIAFNVLLLHQTLLFASQINSCKYHTRSNVFEMSCCPLVFLCEFDAMTAIRRIVFHENYGILNKECTIAGRSELNDIDIFDSFSTVSFHINIAIYLISFCIGIESTQILL
jgi:hypothetical protein